MFFKQFYGNHLSQASCLVGCRRTGEAIIIDPVHDLSKYIEVTDSKGLTITQTTETHIHADFASGIRGVAKRLNANIYVSGEGEDALGYKNMPSKTQFVKHEDVIQVGNVKLEVLHTPGHAPESTNLLLTDLGGGSSVPMGLFSGDFISVGDIGRPDLLEKSVRVKDSTEISAEQMYEPVQNIKSSPDYVQIWPGHGAESPCGKALSAIPISTTGHEKINNWAFNETGETKFIGSLISNQPASPHHFAQMKQVSQFGMNLYQSYDVYPSLDSKRVTSDLRSKGAFHGGHTKGTINIPYNKNFINQISWYLDFEKDIDLIGDRSTIEKVRHTLQLIGFDKVAGCRLSKSGISTQSVHGADMTDKKEHVLDVCNDEEWNNGHLDQAVNIPHGKLLNENIPLNKEDKTYAHCQSGVRSSIAVGILESRGFENMVNIREGYQGFLESLK